MSDDIKKAMREVDEYAPYTGLAWSHDFPAFTRYRARAFVAGFRLVVYLGGSWEVHRGGGLVGMGRVFTASVKLAMHEARKTQRQVHRSQVSQKLERIAAKYQPHTRHGGNALSHKTVSATHYIYGSAFCEMRRIHRLLGRKRRITGIVTLAVVRGLFAAVGCA